MVLIISLLSSLSLSTLLQEPTYNLTYSVGDIYRNSLSESGFVFEGFTKTGTMPNKINETIFNLTLYTESFYPNITDSSNLYNFTTLRTDASQVSWNFANMTLENRFGKVKFDSKITLGALKEINFDKYINISQIILYNFTL